MDGVAVEAGCLQVERRPALEKLPRAVSLPFLQRDNDDEPAHPGNESTFDRITYNLMVVDHFTDEALDQLFHALADGTRRDILRRSARAELSVSRLAQAYPMSFAAVQKHVGVLERAGLVTKERRGREQLVHADPAAVERARLALIELEKAWRGRVERMSDLLAQMPPPGRKNTTKGEKR
jgi:DNA-binding transcriptional ArsR family regulator